MAVQLPKTIRQWFTPEQACEYLSRAFECEVLQKDLDYFSENLPLYIRTNETISGLIPIFKELYDFEPIYRNFLNTEHGRGMVQFKVHSGIFKVRSVEWDRDFCVRCYQIDLSTEKVAFGENIDSQEMNFNTNSLNLNFILHESEEQAFRDEKTEIFNVIIGQIGYPRHELDRFINSQTEPTPKPQEIKDLNPTERDALHNIIKALANMVIDPTAPKEKEKSDEQRGKPPFKNQTQLIEFLSDKESGLGEWRGLSRPNLEKVFAKANKTDSP